MNLLGNTEGQIYLISIFDGKISVVLLFVN